MGAHVDRVDDHVRVSVSSSPEAPTFGVADVIAIMYLEPTAALELARQMAREADELLSELTHRRHAALEAAARGIRG